MAVFAMLVVLAAVLGLGVIAAFARSDPASLARMLKVGVGAIMVGGGLVLAVAGRAALGVIAVAIGGLILAVLLRPKRVIAVPAQRSSGKACIRTAVLEIEIDPETGAMDGLVLAGRFENRTLADLSRGELAALYRDMQADIEGLHLMEAYLDRRLPAWRGHAKANVGERLRPAPGAGSMTEQEAHQVLGLGPGAGEAEIRDAHRRLMKRVQSGPRGSRFMASRFDEARDMLLRRHK